MKNGNKLLRLTLPIIIFLLCSCDIIYRQYSDTDYLLIDIDNPNEIIFISPVFADEWKQLSEVLIKWNSSGTLTEVDVELYKKNHGVFTIKKQTDNTGELRWTIPNDIPNSVQYNIRISNSYNPDEYWESERFAITE
ncbi:MAG: GPI anchored serine-threonine rich family protein [Ignavibacteriaceae bacterium]